MKIAIRRYLANHFTLDDIYRLCVEFDVDFEQLSGKGAASKSWSFISLLDKDGRIDDLASYLRKNHGFSMDINEEASLPYPIEQLVQTSHHSNSQRAKGKFIVQAYNGPAVLNVRQIFETSSEDEKNKRELSMLIRKVEKYWIEGGLKLSLSNLPVMELELVELPTHVENRNRCHPGSGIPTENSLPTGTKLINIFDQIGQSFLLLGEPGAGKTTLLIQFAQDLIERRANNSFQFVPVILNLSSWAKQRKNFSEWLVDELNEFYRIPRRIADRWVERNDLMLILDGLDEMELEYQVECVRAINKYLSEHLVDLIVSSRTSDYKLYIDRLKLDTAIAVMPLTQFQIDKFLNNVGDQFSTIRRILHHDVPLRSLATTPLMLNMMLLAYQDFTHEQLSGSFTLEERRRHLFNVYIARMYDRRRRRPDFSLPTSIETLSWFAKKMVFFNQNPLLVERLSPDWLDTPRQKKVYNSIIGTFGASLGGFVGGWFGWTFAIIIGVLVSFFADPIRWIPRIMPISMFLFIVLGAIYGCGLAISIKEVRLVEKLKWSWEAMEEVFKNLPPLKGRFLVALYSGIQGGEITVKAEPNQGIKLSGRNAAAIIVASTMLVLILNSSNESLWYSLIFGFLLGVFLSLRLGLFTVVQHFAIRFALYLDNKALWNCVRFLEFAVDRIYIFRVGGSYIFHRLMLEHFANLTPTDIDQIHKYQGTSHRSATYSPNQISYSKEINMDIVTTAIISALAAGTAAGITEVSKEAIKSAYSGLVKLIRQKFGDHSDVAAAISNLEMKPDSKARQEVVREEIEAANVYKDVEVERMAKTVIEAVKSFSEPEQHVQHAIGNFIAQADRGSTAKVEVNKG